MALEFNPKVPEQTADVSRGRETRSSIVKLLISLALLVAALYVGSIVGGNILASTISEEREVEWFDRTEITSVKHKERKRAEKIFEKLQASTTMRPLRYRLIVIEMGEANAFAFPGGLVGVTSKLLDEIKSEAGLAMVLAHELGHHQQRHVLRRLGQQLIVQLLRGVVFGDASFAGATGDLTVELGSSSYSRSNEKEADDFGLRLVKKTYGHTKGALEFFEYVQSRYSWAEGLLQAPTASHPLTKGRIKNLKRLQKKLAKRAI